MMLQQARHSRWLVVLGLLLTVGCDLLVFTDTGLVKKRIRTHAEAVTARDWARAAKLIDARFQWQQGSSVLKGEAGIKAFWSSISSIHNCDAFHTVVNSISKVGPEQILANVTFQAHLIESSMTMQFSNITWEGQMGWVKHGSGDWRILFIKELTPRTKGKFSRVGV